MRIVFVNLHVNGFFLRDIGRLLTRKRAITKHRFLLDELLRRQVEVADLVTLGGSGLPTPALRRHTRSYLLRRWEARLVFWRNGIPRGRIRLLTDPGQIRPDDVVVYYGTFENGQFENISRVGGVKVVDHIHFYGDREKAELLRGNAFAAFLYEVDLRKYSRLYRKNYGWFRGKYLMRPYAFAPRFRPVRPFALRKNKAVAMGTLTRCRIPEFLETYGTDCYQPRRKMILDEAGRYPAELDSFISEYQERPLSEIREGDPAPVRLVRQVGNYLRAGRQKAYFSFDMAETYNDYQMFLCPEDIHGSYGVGTLEGMACGCAMLGVDYGAFEDLGMTAGRHYIAYDGTMEDLIRKIRYYQREENRAELERVAENGCRFVRENFSQEKVAQYYCETLERLSRRGRKELA